MSGLNARIARIWTKVGAPCTFFAWAWLVFAACSLAFPIPPCPLSMARVVTIAEPSTTDRMATA